MRCEYLLLVAPASNRVYAGEAPRLTQAELTAFGEMVLGGQLREPAPVTLGGVPYLRFTTEQPLASLAVRYLSSVSSAYALFQVEGELLRPVALSPLGHYDDDLVTIPKYAGKTNEQFTQLLRAGLLRRGGALGLAFNTHVVGRDEVAALLDKAGLSVVATPEYQGFTHWVDQGITRALLVARNLRQTA